MKLQRISIENYRNFKHFELEFEPDCTILIGENNSGKTNVLAAVYANLRANRLLREGAFDAHDYHLEKPSSLPGEAGPIQLTVTFAERVEDEWNVELVSLLEPIINFNAQTNLRSVVVRVNGKASSSTEEADYDWTFLGTDGAPTPQKHVGLLGRLQSLRPLSTLDALRDASKEFSQRSAFFGAFTRNPKFDDTVRDALLQALGDINGRVLAAHAVFGVLKENLNAGHSVVQSTAPDAASIEAVPSRISDLLANTQVSFQNRAGVALPLDRQGSGTQSLSVLSLFRAYVEAKLLAQGEPMAEPILTIEEPEGHLHPSGARAIWSLLERLPGQRIVTSHSGDLVGEAPLRCIRRISHRGGVAVSHRVDEAQFSEGELQHLNFYVRLSRGELLFANSWLLVEGKSEILLLQGIARIANVDLYARGIRVIEYASHGQPPPFIKLADQLGIGWHCLVDNEATGLGYAEKARSLLNGRLEVEHLTVLDHGKLEMFLCKNGFAAECIEGIPAARQPLLTEAPGTDLYYQQIIDLMHDTEKIPTVLRIRDRIIADPTMLPPLLKKVIDVCAQKALQ